MKTKYCYKCKQVRPVEHYYKDRTRSDGLSNLCTPRKKLYRVNGKKYNYGTKYLRDWYKRHPNRAAKYRKIHADKNRSKRATNQAIKDGVIERGFCEICKSDKTEAHHEDYNKPLSVTWLCKSCHSLWHRLLNEWERQGFKSLPTPTER